MYKEYGEKIGIEHGEKQSDRTDGKRRKRMDRTEIACSAWFQKIEHFGAVTLFRLQEHFGTMFRAYEGQESMLREVLTAKQYTAFKAARYAGEPLAYLEKVESMGIRYVPFRDEVYPQKLRCIPDPPFGLFVKGNLPDESRPGIAMVGARACSEYGKAVARKFAAELASYGVQVISGMARGIDSVSQQACLEAGGRTFAVLGNGVDICYPGELKGLYNEIQKYGGLISFYAPGMPPAAGNFPPRNRIISGLSDVVLVVEARRKSGTLITVDMALEQGREVAVVPGRITDELSQGCYDLIKQGASMIMETEQLLELLTDAHKLQSFSKDFFRKESDTSHKNERNGIDISSIQGLDEKLRSIFKVLDLDPAEPEFLYAKWQKEGKSGTFQSFMEGLMDLELMDLCKSEKNRFSIR